METVELIVYFVLAVIAGSLVFAFLRSNDWQKTENSINNAVQKDKEKLAFSTTKAEFAKHLYDEWEACEFGRKEHYASYYIQDEGMLTRDFVLLGIRKMNRENDLKQEDLNMADLIIPKVVLVRCGDGQISIE